VTKHAMTLAFVFALAVGSGVIARAQQPTAPPAANASAPAQPVTQAPLTPLKLQVVISKYQGEKKVSSLPYTLAVNANENGRQAELSSVIQILIPMVTVNEKTTGPVYKDVGTTIKCAAMTMDGGRFKLELAVEDASVYPESKIPADGARGPWLQSFRSSQTLILKDGQTTQYTTATDKVSGDIVKIDVTLTVVK
jgi:hypothetical protein